jgi:hypothetical protein
MRACPTKQKLVNSVGPLWGGPKLLQIYSPKLFLIYIKKKERPESRPFLFVYAALFRGFAVYAALFN